MTAHSMSLRLRLFLVILSPLVLVSILLGYWRFAVAQTTAEALFDRGLLAAGMAISRDVTNSEGDALSPRTRQLISDAGGGEVFYHVTGPGGSYVTGYAYPPAQFTPIDGDIPQYSVADYKGEQVRVLRMAETATTGNLLGQSVVTVWQRVSDRSAFASDLARRAAALIVALLVALAVVVWFGVQLGLRPLRDLQNAIAIRSPDDLSRIQRPVPTEVSGIVATLNRLFGQVEASISTHQAFISDAAHQLRNPATALLLLAETLPGVRDPDEKRKREKALIDAARKSARLAVQLLSLERLRYDGSHLKSERFDLNKLAADICADLGPEILSRNLTFEFDPSPEELVLRGDPVLVGEAIGNLIDNALQHGGPKLSTISVQTRQENNRAIVTVQDDGSGLSPQDEVLAFRRFGQVHPGEGSGLGLSIVLEVARGHGGDVEVMKAETGARLQMRLPLSEETPDVQTKA